MYHKTKKTLGRILQQVFTFTLVLYLVLFLLENLFPGFVSNSFDLNILLIPLFGVGVLTSFFPEPADSFTKLQTPPKRSDYLTVAGFTILTFIVIWYKLSDLPEIRFWVALGSSVLVMLMSLLILIFPEDEQEPDKSHTSDQEGKKLKWKKLVKKYVFQPVRVPFFAVVIAILILIFAGTRTSIVPHDTSDPSRSEIDQALLDAAPLTPQEKAATQIYIYDLTNTRSDVASEMVASLEDDDFVIVSKGTSPEQYDHAVVQFDPDDARVVRELELILSDAYPDLEKLPLPPSTDTTNHIILILK